MSQYSRGNEIIFESEEAPRDIGGDAVTSAVAAASALLTSSSSAGVGSDVDNAPLRPAAAFEVFQGRIFDVAAYDGAVSRADSVERRVESPLQRFARLRSELADLKADLDAMTTDGADASNGGGKIWGVLQGEAGRMVAEAESLEAEHPALAPYRALRAGGAISDSDLTAQLQNLLISSQQRQLSALSASSNTPTTGAELALASHNAPVMDAATAAQLALLEKRIFSLETLIGINANIMDVEGVSSQTGSGGTKLLSLPGRGAFVFPLAETVANLTSRVALVLKAAETDGEAFATVRTRINTMKSDLEALQRERAKLPAVDARVLEAAAALQDVHKKLKLVEAFANDIPTLLLRLKTLERLHVDAATFSVRLAEVEEQCRLIQDRVDSNGQVLREVKQGMEANLATMLENIKSVDTRIHALQAKRKA